MAFSKLTLYWKALVAAVTPGRSVFEAVTDYLLEIGNNLVQGLPSTKKARLESIASIARTVHQYLVKYSDMCPAKWVDEFKATTDAFLVVINAISDLKITRNEIKDIVASWKNAYSAWTSEDEDYDEVPGDVKAVE